MLLLCHITLRVRVWEGGACRFSRGEDRFSPSEIFSLQASMVVLCCSAAFFTGKGRKVFTGPRTHTHSFPLVQLYASGAWHHFSCVPPLLLLCFELRAVHGYGAMEWCATSTCVHGGGGTLPPSRLEGSQRDGWFFGCTLFVVTFADDTRNSKAFITCPILFATFIFILLRCSPTHLFSAVVSRALPNSTLC
eukprot:RCo008749